MSFACIFIAWVSYENLIQILGGQGFLIFLEANQIQLDPVWSNLSDN